jgi:DNA-directed RNA polymerase subunit H (RpoH/RPB5)
MQIHSLGHDSYFEDEYSLIGIHTTLEDYKLAYLLNQTLAIQLSKSNCPIELQSKQGKSNFQLFIYEDEIQDVCWSLIENHSIITEENEVSIGIFDAIETRSYLLPEIKKADFILKIENNNTQFDAIEFAQKINQITQVSTAYPIDIANFKSKNNLIF